MVAVVVVVAQVAVVHLTKVAQVVLVVVAQARLVLLTHSGVVTAQAALEVAVAVEVTAPVQVLTQTGQIIIVPMGAGMPDQEP